ncbi:MAG: hypothetical protein WD708_06855 [Kiritimatiellia bacterium]
MKNTFATLPDDLVRYAQSRAVPGPEYGRFRYGIGKEPTYWASAFMVLALDLVGKLDQISTEQRRQWRDYLQASQDPETGLCLDPAFRSGDRHSPSHTDDMVHWHSTTFILGALILLGGKPKYPISVIHPFLEPAKMRAWIEQLPWRISPWVVGNWTYDFGCLAGFERMVSGPEKINPALDAFFAWHDTHQLPATGWWDLTGKAPVTHQQYGGYHTLMVYWMFDREVPRPEAMIDRSLSIQSPEGHFGGGCCADMDVIDATVSLCRQYDLSRSEVTRAMERALPWMAGTKLPGSGFLDVPNAKQGRAEYGWKTCGVAADEPDPCSAHFRTFSLALMSELIDVPGLEGFRWKHHHTFCHGVRPAALRCGD